MTAEDSLQRAEELLARLETARAELEQVAQQENPDAAIELLNELAALAREVETELSRARREAGA
ncbi:MAG: hypothetical protein M3123_01540 [Actinomycetota bacterium]|nr:hypothetical protein [Actinomycetota bacterium]